MYFPSQEFDSVWTGTSALTHLLPKNCLFLIQGANPPSRFSFFPSSWSPSQLKPCVQMNPLVLSRTQRLQRFSLRSTHDAVPRIFSTFVLQLSYLCFLFDKLNRWSLCILPNQTDHHDQLPVQSSALIPGLAVAVLKLQLRNPQSCSKSELVLVHSLMKGFGVGFCFLAIKMKMNQAVEWTARTDTV